MNWYKRDWLPHALTLVALYLWWDLIKTLFDDIFRCRVVGCVADSEAIMLLVGMLLFSISIVLVYRSNIWGYFLSVMSILVISSSGYIGSLPTFMRFDSIHGVMCYLELPVFGILLLYSTGRFLSSLKEKNAGKIFLLNITDKLSLFTRSLILSFGKQILLFIWLLWWLFSPIASYIDFKNHYTNYWDSFLQYNLETPFRYPDNGILISFGIIIIVSALAYYNKSAESFGAKIGKTSAFTILNILFFCIFYGILFSWMLLLNLFSW